MTLLQALQAALEIKQGKGGVIKPKAAIPSPLAFVTASCQRIASDGKPYTLTFEEGEHCANGR